MYKNGAVARIKLVSHPYTIDAVRVSGVWVVLNDTPPSGYRDDEVTVLELVSEGYEKPLDEPQRFAAIVKADGYYYVKTGLGHGYWEHILTNNKTSWNYISARNPTVLFEGVINDV